MNSLAQHHDCFPQEKKTQKQKGSKIPAPPGALHAPNPRVSPPCPPLTSGWLSVLFSHDGLVPLPAGRGPRDGSPPVPAVVPGFCSGIRDTRNLQGDTP